MDRLAKLSILADAAKYDASCASSGAAGRTSSTAGGIGSTTGMGICHSFAPDGRCISLLKLLLTNFCLYDCRYCVNRRSSDVPRARFAVGEVVDLTLDFYRRNYIEGLFLSSGVIRSPDYTMEQLVEVARRLRDDHDFRGYIHLKTIPSADPKLIELAGRYADRLSVNIELPSEAALARLAPEKEVAPIRVAMADIRRHRDAAKEEPRAPRFAPAGQSTQMIVGADPSTDRAILETAGAKNDKDGWSALPEGRLMTLYAAHQGVQLTIAKVEAVKSSQRTVWARSSKGETYVVSLDDLFAAALDRGHEAASVRKAGFLG